ncbi:fused 4'-phosphopantothenoylcysteine decarboxylase; phosphopantothenoylcysteine synthetase, FMN-binding [Candidatus Terasakiella magnetica]|uniref:Coenzyme A biosynthesis bifunctional protein CoaBC n=1 Tax=Candidatus Terasakiella magnetica TaxID=1867952 RepID=A0A1C3RI93_9PROT|nr:bifunctional phosphopantothenoylcysteine decarboxylase/phosphopantothenate--cysteine ligase CoaBC [Candidatus Terasakiella magnetica]SCA56989.1 fused 4'-phosphopantothenoylcysteine decarboxylase; phosphopantothenoylcysteine synthetase, FMN-binding [Candidatus Terasakiella magnetica]
MYKKKRILLIITGGIAAYKTPELVRRLREQEIEVRCILTKSAKEFVTPLALGAVSGDKVYEDLFDLDDESEMGHIQLSRSADLVVVAPATANTMAKAAHGLADDLATTTLLATDKPVMMAPAMNVRMWEHDATQANVETLLARGVEMIGPDEGDMACGEFGLGRMVDPLDIVGAVKKRLTGSGPLTGKKAIVTSGPTHEPIDPVRYIANRSSGKQGHAIAASLAKLGCDVTLVSGPTQEPAPNGVDLIKIESARDMLQACENALPADIAVCAAAVADWRVDIEADQKLKKDGSGQMPDLKLAENPDILATLSQHKDKRPSLVVGFAAETEKVIEHATAKRERKNCDWIVANDVSPSTGTFGGNENTVHLIAKNQCEDWPRLCKSEVADRLAQKIADHMKEDQEHE